MIYVGIDNGVTGSYCAIDDDNNVLDFRKMPVIKMQDWTKAKKQITRIDYKALFVALRKLSPVGVCIERPLHNGRMFSSSISGARALEAVLIALGELQIPFSIVSARDWQKAYLSGLSGNTKERTLIVAQKYMKDWQEDFKKHGDADAYFLARYAKDYEKPHEKN